ncbi:MAG: response regulator transcription factor, partial [Candidatus Limnocylindria bacterium]|nr:response regulator transcription factor [Candidatus Limnocylindria bacterium]
MDAQVDRPLRVLVVDDDPGVTSVVERTLGREGYEVRTAGDGALTLHVLREWVADAIILDIVMPGTDGIALCARLRTAYPALGILMLTARDGTLDHVAGLDAGADDYLVKPFSPPVLLAHLRAVFRRREPDPETLGYADLTLDTATR